MFAKYGAYMDSSRRIFIIILTTICLISIYSFSRAQSDHLLGNWSTLIVKGKITSKISTINEIHFRSSNYSLKYDYYEIKAGVSYAFANNFYGLIGSGIYRTYQTGELFQLPLQQKEFRTWLELNYKYVIKRLNFEHRLRLEQRFFPDNYKNGLKCRLGIICPVNKSEMVQGSIYLSTGDELFFAQHNPIITKNRFYAGAGYKINENTAFQIGCVNDTDFELSDYSAKNYLQIMVIFDFSTLVKKQS
ncbi:MAG: DUF2490 domain-containing protein [Mariniphaga sp.]